MNNKLKVGLVYGGKSGEHDVSLQTALAVIQAFDFEKYEIKPFYITKQGEWVSGKRITERIATKEQLLLQGEGVGEGGGSSAVALAPIFGAQSLAESQADATGGERIDVIFPLLHGTFGEDGTIQGLMEMANIPYVGAGVLASAAGMDKVIMKKLFAEAGLAQCMYRYFTRHQWKKDASFYITEIEVTLGYPCFVKPANLGSSVGISKAKNREELIAAIEEALRFDRKIIVEELVEGREIEVAILGNDEPMASVPGEVVSSSDFYDYRAKYVDGKSAMVIPADIPEGRKEEVRELALRAFEAIDGSGLSRVDFFMREHDGRFLINEINTMPGFTPYSMYPLLWKESGKNYQELLDDLIRLAMERYNEKQQNQYVFDI
ncbi:D-alanine--D-alanine ligase [Xylanibacillus composti]|uniref:D-alanine--D-alanine ligase n=1 Tax=Xylanibacillus composti TaxID=1572762 RepID=A0A8J4M2J6_9BACL|nr:D-alanine--D-alanine ligase [Xylanibacillus composti]MDT9725859.1 D-alanine--D-alanine ligase [Xylanibacillus composti]GIQ69185.1 D-alanine--D-alanine ligase [Xylanibacillus composti]